MLSLFIMCLGLGLVIWSLYLIRRDIERGNISLTKGLSGVSDHNLERIVHYLDELEKQMNDMNTAFYELVSDLEGSFSIHDKEIQLITERIERIEKQMRLLTSEVRIENQPVVQATGKSSAAKIRSYQPKSTIEPVSYDPSVGPNNNYGTAVEAVSKEAGSSSPEPQKILTLGPDEAHLMKQRILALRKEGHSLAQIAKSLNVGLGELQLFIKLNTK